jgi:S-adenosylmethionine synthetase
LYFVTAKSLVAAGLARRVLVQLSYAIGVAEPLSIYVDTYGTGKKTDEELVAIIRNNWDLRPGVIGKRLVFSTRFGTNPSRIVRELDLQKPQYLKTASYGHFGKLFLAYLVYLVADRQLPGNPAYNWEKPKQLKL